MQVLNDMVPYMPIEQGHLIDQMQIVEPGLIEINTPYAHYQYIGLVRTDKEGRTVVKKQKKKPILTERPLHYKEPGATDHWFEEAKQQHGQEWVDLVKREVGKG